MSITSDLMYNINRWAEDMPIEEIALMSPAEFGKIIHQNERLGGIAVTSAQQFPHLSIEHALQPLSHDLLRIRLTVTKDFQWSDKHHGKAQYFWVWLSDEDDRDILQITKVILRDTTTEVSVDFTVLLSAVPSKLHVRSVSDTWLGSESSTEIELSYLVLPTKALPLRKPLDLPYEPSRVHPDLYELLRQRATILSSFEAQCMHSLFFSSANALVAAPSSDARYQLLSVPIWRNVKRSSSSISLVLSPTIASTKQLCRFLQQDLNFASSPSTTVNISLISKTAALRAALEKTDPSAHTIVVTSPRTVSQLFPLSLGDSPAASNMSLDLLLADDLHALSAEYELCLSYCIAAFSGRTRLVGFSASLLDASSLAAWLQVASPHVYAFHPSSRPDAVVTSTSTFNLPHSPSLLKAMVKPAYDAMRANTSGRTICFVPHRGQCFATLADLLTHSATDLDNKFAEMDEAVLSQYTARVSDPKIAEGLLHGFALLSEGAHPTDQAIAKHLFSSGAVRVLIVPREAAYTLDLTANLVIVMSTQYAYLQTETGERTILDYPLDDLLQMQTKAASSSDQDSAQFSVYTQQDKASLILRFLNNGIPLESSLPDSVTLFQALLGRVHAGQFGTKQAILDAIATTYMSHRMAANPAYYGCMGDTAQEQISGMVDDLVESWRVRLLIRVSDSTCLRTTALGDQILRNRVSLSALDNLLSCTEGKALKVLGTRSDDTVKADEQLDAWLRRLPKSVQRRIKPDAEGEGLSHRKALVITLLARKLPPAGSQTERDQAVLAMDLLDRLGARREMHSKPRQ
jgi:antiviral helicase SLH1